jgi:negative regulator of flagellin synthesis FlgM
MAMKINDSIKNSTGLGVEKPGTGKAGAPKAGATASNAQTEATSAESVTLSPLSAQLKSLEKKVAASSVFDAEKVEAIKSAIANGQFKVDSEKVADGLINSVKDLLSTQK